MTLIHAVILGIVEGITEFLPISSTGHLILTQKLLGMPETDVLKSFDIAIQLGAILAVVIIYARTLLRSKALWWKVDIAFIPTAIIGLLLHSVVKTYLLGNSTVVAWSLLLGGAVIILFEKTYREPPNAAQNIDNISVKQALAIGFCQSFAIVPGVSRAAATILGGMWLGIDRRTIVDFSFLLAIPTMTAAVCLDLLKSASSFSQQDTLMILVGFSVAFVTAFAAIRWLLKFVQHHTFTVFGVYRIAIGVMMLLWI